MNAPQRHIVHSFDDELSVIQAQVTHMGEMVTGQLASLLEAVGKRDAATAFAVTRNESQVNAQEIKIDTQIFLVLAKRCPVASDLRLVMAASKIVTQLERAGDEVAKVANVLLEQLLPENVLACDDLMAATLASGSDTLNLLRAVMRAFTDMDFAAARDLASQSRPRAELNASMSQIMEAMQDGPQGVKKAVGQIMIMKAIDRLNDLAYEIAKDVVFLGDETHPT